MWPCAATLWHVTRMEGPGVIATDLPVAFDQRHAGIRVMMLYRYAPPFA